MCFPYHCHLIAHRLFSCLVCFQLCSSWHDFAKFMTGFSIVCSVAIPSVLFHSGLIVLGAMLFQFGSLLLFALTGALFIIATRSSDSYGPWS